METRKQPEADTATQNLNEETSKDEFQNNKHTDTENRLNGTENEPVTVFFSGKTDAAGINFFSCINFIPANRTPDCAQIGIQCLGGEAEDYEIEDGELRARFRNVSFNIWDENCNESGFKSADGRAELLRGARVDELVCRLYDENGKRTNGPISDVCVKVVSGNVEFELPTPRCPLFC